MRRRSCRRKTCCWHSSWMSAELRLRGTFPHCACAWPTEITRPAKSHRSGVFAFCRGGQEEVLEQKERSGPTMVMAHLQGRHTRGTTQDVADQWHEVRGRGLPAAVPGCIPACFSHRRWCWEGCSRKCLWSRRAKCWLPCRRGGAWTTSCIS